MKIFCLPFAGASKYSYRGYMKMAPESITLVPVELPGRGSRSQETLLRDIDVMVLDIFEQIKHQLAAPYAIYGHSMGGLIGLELARKISYEGHPRPAHLFFSGCTAPSLKRNSTGHSQLPQTDFFRILDEYGGCPDELLANHDLMCFFEPILRADFQAVESYRYQKKPVLDIPIDVYLGTGEKITYEDGIKWQEETTEKVHVRQFPGKHFFIFGHEQQLMNLIAITAHQSLQRGWQVK